MKLPAQCLYCLLSVVILPKDISIKCIVTANSLDQELANYSFIVKHSFIVNIPFCLLTMYGYFLATVTELGAKKTK